MLHHELSGAKIVNCGGAPELEVLSKFGVAPEFKVLT